MERRLAAILAADAVGHTSLKNVAEPVRVYRVKTAAPMTAEASPAGAGPPS